jgi:hypothetical protein
MAARQRRASPVFNCNQEFGELFSPHAPRLLEYSTDEMEQNLSSFMEDANDRQNRGYSPENSGFTFPDVRDK